MSDGETVLLVGGGEGCWEAVIADLEDDGLKIVVVGGGAEGMVAFDAGTALVVINAALPDMAGTALCRTLRSRSQVPIIMLVERNAEADVLACFEAGADDCVVTPFRVLELCARMRAAMRKAARLSGGRPSAFVEAGNVSLDPVHHEVTVAGRWLHMPAKEFALLQLLMANPGKVVRRDVIMQQVWGRDRSGDSKTLDAHVNRLRQRLQDFGATAAITTVRGRGYRYELVDDPTQLVLSA